MRDSSPNHAPLGQSRQGKVARKVPRFKGLGLVPRDLPAEMPACPQKITFGDMRESGARNVVIYCRDYRCHQRIEMSADRWTDDIGLSDVEPHFVCTRCGRRVAEVRPKLEAPVATG